MSYCSVLWWVRRQTCTKTQYCLWIFCSYSIILLEIATRSDPIPVSRPSWGPWPANNRFFVSCFWRILEESHVFQAEESNVESTWCPPLPELISSKADSTCPCPADYVEVSSPDIPYILQPFSSFVGLWCSTFYCWSFVQVRPNVIYRMQQAWEIYLSLDQVRTIKLFNEWGIHRFFNSMVFI